MVERGGRGAQGGREGFARREEGREDGGWGEGLEGADIKDKLCFCWAIILEIFFPALTLGLLKYICTELLTRVHPPNNTLNQLK